MSNTTHGTLLMIAAIFAFSIMDAFANALSTRMHTMQVVWARYNFQVAASLIVLAPHLTTLMKTRYIGAQLLRSCFLFAATMTFFFSFAKLSLPEATAIFQLAPIFITLGAFLFLGERFGIWRWLGVIAGFIGVLIIIRPGLEGYNWYSTLPILAGIFYASYTLSTRALGRDESPWTSFLYTALIGVVVSTAIVPFYWTSPDLTGWLLMIFLGVFGGIGHYLLIKSLSLAEASILAPWTYASMVFSIMWGAVVFGEYIDPLTALGATIIIAAGLFIWWRENRAERLSH